eukprot:scaffold47933_cov68-Cyclotella_meneghiniana.AAC.3
MTEYGKPSNPKVTWDKLQFYKARDLAAHHMYNKQHSDPIVLFCMSIGVPNCTPHDLLADDDCIKKALASGKGGMFKTSQLIPTNKPSGKKYLQKELLRRAVIADPSDLPRPANRNIDQLVKSLLDLPPDESEHEFIVSAIEQLNN